MGDRTVSYAKVLVAGLRALHTNNDDTRAFLREAADYIERTANNSKRTGARTHAKEIIKNEAKLRAWARAAQGDK